jgi:hypothetical protein
MNHSHSSQIQISMLAFGTEQAYYVANYRLCNVF